MSDGLRVGHVGIQVEQQVHGAPAARRQLALGRRRRGRAGRRRRAARVHGRVRALVQRAVACGQAHDSKCERENQIS